MNYDRQTQYMKTQDQTNPCIMNHYASLEDTESRRPPAHAGHHADCPCPRTRPSVFDFVGSALPLGVGTGLVGLGSH